MSEVVSESQLPKDKSNTLSYQQLYKNAVENFSYLVHFDLEDLGLEDRLIEGIECGTIRKFKFSTDYCWKLIKKFLKQEDGVDAKTPKQSVKEFYLAGYIGESDYLTLIEMIDDRNSLSYIYDEDEFRKVLKKFPGYAKVFKEIETVIESNWNMEKS